MLNYSRLCAACWLLQSVMKLMMTGRSERQAGVMIPIPQYPLYTATIAEYHAQAVSRSSDETEKRKPQDLSGVPQPDTQATDRERSSLCKIGQVQNSSDSFNVDAIL